MAKEQTEISQAEVQLAILQTLKDLKAQPQTNSADMTQALAQITETLAGVANRSRPENPNHNGISAYSNPKGDYADPKPEFKCAFYWCGYPLPHENHTAAEIEALNSLEPGEYRVTKGNGNVIPFTVEGKKNQNGKLEEIWVRFPCKGDQSTDHRSLIDYCKEAMGENVPSLQELLAEIRALKTKNADLEMIVATA